MYFQGPCSYFFVCRLLKHCSPNSFQKKIFYVLASLLCSQSKLGQRPHCCFLLPYSAWRLSPITDLCTQKNLAGGQPLEEETMLGHDWLSSLCHVQRVLKDQLCLRVGGQKVCAVSEVEVSWSPCLVTPGSLMMWLSVLDWFCIKTGES